MTRALLTGFGPFPGAPVNPTGAVIEAAAKAAPTGLDFRTLVLDTQYAAVDGALAQMADMSPDIVVMTGLAQDAARVRIELVARNAVAAGRPDAAGRTFDDAAIMAGAPDCLETTADLTRLIGALSDARVDFELSRDAGGYVCNFAYFHALRRYAPARIVFVHLPMTHSGFAAAGPAAFASGPVRQRLLPDAEAIRAITTILGSQRH